MNAIITENLEALKKMCQANQIDSLYAFGSVCTGEFDENSDIDLLVSFKEMDFAKYTDTFFNMAQKLENLLQRPVDLITESSLRNPYFIKKVNQTKKLLYAAGN